MQCRPRLHRDRDREGAWRRHYHWRDQRYPSSRRSAWIGRRQPWFPRSSARHSSQYGYLQGRLARGYRLFNSPFCQALCSRWRLSPSCWRLTLVGIILFIAFVGFSSGLNSICRGSLPLSVFGPDGYGARVGLITAVRLSTASFAPFFFNFIKSNYGVRLALASLAVCAIASTVSFAFVSARSKCEPGR